LRAAGQPADETAILDDIRRRDERDRNRAIAPLKPADDAIELDTSNLDVEAAVAAAIRIVESARR
jgi:cytidylate kinase